MSDFCVILDVTEGRETECAKRSALKSLSGLLYDRAHFVSVWSTNASFRGNKRWVGKYIEEHQLLTSCDGYRNISLADCVITALSEARDAVHLVVVTDGTNSYGDWTCALEWAAYKKVAVTVYHVLARISSTAADFTPELSALQPEAFDCLSALCCCGKQHEYVCFGSGGSNVKRTLLLKEAGSLTEDACSVKELTEESLAVVGAPVAHPEADDLELNSLLEMLMPGSTGIGGCFGTEESHSSMDSSLDILLPAESQAGIQGVLQHLLPPEKTFAIPMDDTSVDLDFTKCPLTGRPLQHPVIASDGITYEQSSLEYILRTNRVSPVTGEVLADTFIPNHLIGSIVRMVEDAVSC